MIYKIYLALQTYKTKGILKTKFHPNKEFHRITES